MRRDYGFVGQSATNIWKINNGRISEEVECRTPFECSRNGSLAGAIRGAGEGKGGGGLGQSAGGG